MEFLETLGTVLGIVKKGAEVFNTLNQKDEDTGFASPKLIDLESNLTAAKAPLNNMEQVVGLGIPRMDAMYRYFADNQSRDTNLRSLQANNFVASRRKSVPQTMTVAGNANVKGFTASYNTTGVMSG
tara:strand:+ start:1353 stop:1733 length:381 start_codon:yes stop_codon:yes gene_type:complete